MYSYATCDRFNARGAPENQEWKIQTLSLNAKGK